MTANAARMVDYLGPLNLGRRFRHTQAPVWERTIPFSPEMDIDK
jgi:hypothetical protein